LASIMYVAEEGRGTSAMNSKARETPTDRNDALDDAVSATLVASRALVGVAARSLAALESDVTAPQYRALVVLSSRGEQNVGMLADALQIHPSTATRLCDRLLAKGLIDRATSDENRRTVTVTLSAAGRALVAGVTRSRRRELRRILGRLDPDTTRALIDALGAFTAAAGELPDDAWKLGWTT
jgi:DNA-binding MarR family transcriptional regulator